MHRRKLISALACWPATRVLAQDDAGRPHRKVSADQLGRTLAARFPVRFGLPGLFDIQVHSPRLLLLPARQRLGATVLARVGDLTARRVYPGEIDVLFALRYEATDQTVRAHDIAISGLRSSAMPPDAAQAWRALLDNVLRGALVELVLHRFSREELAVPDLLGLQPETMTIEDDGVEIWFAPKRRG
jgi:hypothetical protein